jgi:hypothetical protein
MVQERGFHQPYGEETPAYFFNTSFQTTERNPTIRLSINDEVIFGKYQFFFDEVLDGEPVEKTYKSVPVTCLIERSKDGSETWIGVLDAILTLCLRPSFGREQKWHRLLLHFSRCR